MTWNLQYPAKECQQGTVDRHAQTVRTGARRQAEVAPGRCGTGINVDEGQSRDVPPNHAPRAVGEPRKRWRDRSAGPPGSCRRPPRRDRRAARRGARGWTLRVRAGRRTGRGDAGSACREAECTLCVQADRGRSGAARSPAGEQTRLGRARPPTQRTRAVRKRARQPARPEGAATRSPGSGRHERRRPATAHPPRRADRKTDHESGHEPRRPGAASGAPGGGTSKQGPIPHPVAPFRCTPVRARTKNATDIRTAQSGAVAARPRGTPAMKGEFGVETVIARESGCCGKSPPRGGWMEG